MYTYREFLPDPIDTAVVRHPKRCSVKLFSIDNSCDLGVKPLIDNDNAELEKNELILRYLM